MFTENVIVNYEVDGFALVEALKDRKATQSQLARYCGVRPSLICDAIKGRKRISLALKHKIIMFLSRGA